MSLLARLQDDMKTALKAGQKDRLQVIRMLLSDVKNIDLMPNKPTEQQVIEAYGKRLRKSVEEYDKLGKTDQSAQLKAEIAIVDDYLTKKANNEDTETIVDAFLAANTFTVKQVNTATE